MTDNDNAFKIDWQIHPARLNVKKTILSLMFIAACLVYVFIFWGVLYGFIGLVFLFVSLRSYYLPTRYELTATHIIVSSLFYAHKRPLSEFKMIYEGKNGVLLSPFRRKSFLNNFRGVYLLLPADREHIIDNLRRLIMADKIYPEQNEA